MGEQTRWVSDGSKAQRSASSSKSAPGLVLVEDARPDALGPAGRARGVVHGPGERIGGQLGSSPPRSAARPASSATVSEPARRRPGGASRSAGSRVAFRSTGTMPRRRAPSTQSEQRGRRAGGRRPPGHRVRGRRPRALRRRGAGPLRPPPARGWSPGPVIGPPPHGGGRRGSWCTPASRPGARGAAAVRRRRGRGRAPGRSRSRPAMTTTSRTPDATVTSRIPTAPAMAPWTTRPTG